LLIPANKGGERPEREVGKKLSVTWRNRTALVSMKE